LLRYRLLERARPVVTCGYRLPSLKHLKQGATATQIDFRFKRATTSNSFEGAEMKYNYSPLRGGQQRSGKARMKMLQEHPKSCFDLFACLLACKKKVVGWMLLACC